MIFPADADTNSNPSGSMSVTFTFVALTPAVLFTVIVNLTRVLLPTFVMFATLLIVRLTSTTSTVALSLTIVLFSLDVTFTLLSHMPVALDLATIQYVAFLPLKIVIGAQLTFWPRGIYPSVAFTNANPSGRISLITTTVALTRAVFFTTIVKLTKVLFPTFVTLAVLLTSKITSTTSTVALSLTTVSFSLHVTFTLLSHVPVAFDLATIQYVAFAPLANVAMFQVIF